MGQSFVEGAARTVSGIAGTAWDAISHPLDTLGHLGDAGRQVVSHPVDTAVDAARMVKGYAGKYLQGPDPGTSGLGAVKSAVSNSYGRTLATAYHDPFGTAMDASLLAGGGEALAGRAGMETTAKVLGTGADALNPFTIPARVGGKVVTSVGRRVATHKLYPQVVDNLNEKLSRASAMLDDAKAATKRGVQKATDAGRRGVQAATDTARQGVQAAQTGADAATAAAKTQGADLVEHQREQFQSALKPPPSRPEVQRQVQDVIAGPGQAYKDQLGQAVESAAQSGPAVDFTKVKAEAARMQAATRPTTEMADPAAALVGPSGQPVGSGSLALMRAKGMDTSMFEPQLEPSHPLNGVLGRIADAPDQVSFEDAHRYKRALDDAVNWESPAKKQVQQVTKGVRQQVRSAMSGVNEGVGHAPYETATKAYSDVTPLYKPQVVNQLQQAATQTPKALSSLIKRTDTTKLQGLKDILTQHAGEGGGPPGAAAGSQAWNSVVHTWTYDNLLSGGVEKFGDRLAKLDPEFVQTMYGDPQWQGVLGRMKAIASAFDQRKGVSAAGVERTAAAGEQAVGKAAEAGRQGVRAAGETSRAGVRAATATGQADVAGVKAAQGAYKGLQTQAKATLKPPGVASTLVDLAHVTSLGVPSPFAWDAVKRLLKGPKAADLLSWASYGDARTQQLIKAVTSLTPGQDVADLMRTAGIASNAMQAPPMAVSHAQPAATPPPAAP